MKSFILILNLLLFAACSEHQADLAATLPVQQAEETNLRRYNGNGNGNGNTPPPVPEYQKVEMPPTDWQVVWDTLTCGWLVMRWTDQNRPASTPDLEVSPYRIVVTPRDCPYSADCLTNLFYMRYGTSCMMKASSVYDMQVAYTINDKVKRVLTYYYSKPVKVYTGVMLCE